jgi:ATP-dependent protease ClpP protease subunit
MKCPITIFNYQIVKNAAGTAADVYVDGDIVDASTQEILKDWFGDETSVSYKSFRNNLLNCGVKDVNVYVNSYGGHVGDAMAIHDTIVDLNNNGWNINTHGRGMVCSSATYIVMAGKNGGSVSANTSWLIHNISGGIWGNVNEVENYAKNMRKFNNMVVDFYASKTGLSKETITDWMNNETWLIGKDIADKGFVASSGGAAAFKNQIKPEQWPYSNKAILNSYNSSINNTDTMDYKALLAAIRNEIKGMFNTGFKPEDAETKIAEVICNTVKKLDEDRETAITNAVNAAMTGDAFTNAVTAAVAKQMETVPANVATAITKATEGLVNEQKFEQLLTDLADKVGKPGGLDNKLDDPKDPYAGIKVEL